MKRTISFCSIMAFAGMALAAAVPAGSARAADKQLTIAVVPKALDNAIFLDAKDAAEKRGKELGVNIVWVGSAKSDAAEQVSVLEGLIQKKVDGILVSCNDADALKDVIDRAMDQGIKVATFDSDSPKSKRLFYAGTDNYGIGKKAAEHMKKLVPAGGKVAVLTGVLGAPNLEQRIVGFRDGVKGTKITILPVQTGEDDVQKSVEVVEPVHRGQQGLGRLVLRRRLALLRRSRGAQGGEDLHVQGREDRLHRHVPAHAQVCEDGHGQPAHRPELHGHGDHRDRGAGQGHQGPEAHPRRDHQHRRRDGRQEQRRRRAQDQEALVTLVQPGPEPANRLGFAGASPATSRASRAPARFNSAVRSPMPCAARASGVPPNVLVVSRSAPAAR